MKRLGPLLPFIMLLLTSLFAFGKVVGFFPFHWVWVFSPIWLPMCFLMGLSAGLYILSILCK